MKPAVIFGTSIVAAFVACGSAAHANAFRPNPALKAAVTNHSMVDGELTLAPMAFVRFCLDNPRQCQLAGEESVQLNDELRKQLSDINLDVNRRIAPKADAPGKDRWSLNVTSGDCDDYAVQKRARLIENGWPPKALSLAAVKTAYGENHLVLTVRTNAGDLVLDNLFDSVVFYDETSYRWERRQSRTAPYYWVKLSNAKLDQH